MLAVEVGSWLEGSRAPRGGGGWPPKEKAAACSRSGKVSVGRRLAREEDALRRRGTQGSRGATVGGDSLALREGGVGCLRDTAEELVQGWFWAGGGARTVRAARVEVVLFWLDGEARGVAGD